MPLNFRGKIFPYVIITPIKRSNLLGKYKYSGGANRAYEEQADSHPHQYFLVKHQLGSETPAGQ